MAVATQVKIIRYTTWGCLYISYLFIYLFIFSFIYSFIYLFIYLVIYLFIYLVIYLSIFCMIEQWSWVVLLKGQSFFFNKVTASHYAIFLKSISRHRCFPFNYLSYLKTYILRNIWKRPLHLLNVEHQHSYHWLKCLLVTFCSDYH